MNSIRVLISRRVVFVKCTTCEQEPHAAVVNHRRDQARLLEQVTADHMAGSKKSEALAYPEDAIINVQEALRWFFQEIITLIAILQQL